jgi:hypothetical protein
LAGGASLGVLAQPARNITPAKDKLHAAAIERVRTHERGFAMLEILTMKKNKKTHRVTTVGFYITQITSCLMTAWI